jgi:hypothetical protein
MMVNDVGMDAADDCGQLLRKVLKSIVSGDFGSVEHSPNLRSKGDLASAVTKTT